MVATPVEEVGRDHDFDWAVIEPSSYRSIIQLAGRVRRHRSSAIKQPNISLLQYNWLGIRDHHLDNTPVFKRPGFEEKYKLASHDLKQLVNEKAIGQRLDAIPRITKPDNLTAKVSRKPYQADSLIELEHAATCSWLSSAKNQSGGPQSLKGYLEETWFLTALPQTLTPFRMSLPSIKALLVYFPEQQHYKFCERDEDGYPIEREKILNIQRVALSSLAMSKLWLRRDFASSVQELAQQLEISPRIISLRYGELSFPHDEKQQYQYNDQFGLIKAL